MGRTLSPSHHVGFTRRVGGGTGYAVPWHGILCTGHHPTPPPPSNSTGIYILDGGCISENPPPSHTPTSTEWVDGWFDGGGWVVVHDTRTHFAAVSPERNFTASHHPSSLLIIHSPSPRPLPVFVSFSNLRHGTNSLAKGRGAAGWRFSNRAEQQAVFGGCP